MALQKVGDKALATLEKDDIFKKPAVPKKKVLDEDTYTENLQKIIVRDFFPDLPKLQAQSDYLDALHRNDVVKLRELHIKYGPKRPNAGTPADIYSTPATFETPVNQPGTTPGPSGSKEGGSTTDKDGKTTGKDEPTHNPEPDTSKKKADTDLSLDKYLAKNTSEDNASFAELLQKNQEKHKLKHTWLYEKEVESRQDREEQLALPSVEMQAIEGSSSLRPQIGTWDYSAKNTLMYVPDGAELNAKEMIEKKAPKEIVHNNTRFTAPVATLARNKATIAQAMEHQAQILQGKIGVDGKEIVGPSPKVNGYGFVGTPSPAPGVEESPLMTWGEIEGTPFRLDASDTPIPRTPGPSFRMAEPPRRDQLAHKLAEDVGKAHRAKKAKALKQVSSYSIHSPRFGSALRTERISTMSPAAQRLASSKLGIRTHTDKALRASYTPSPGHRLLGEKTPVSLTPGKTPKSSIVTHKKWGTPKISTPSQLGISRTTTPKRDSSEGLSLTDNLLNLPKNVALTKRTSPTESDTRQTDDEVASKRLRAEDFF